MQCKWEKGRQLKSITDEEGTTVTYTYDVNGLRTSKTVGNETTSYVYENSKLLREVTGNEVIDFIYGSEGIIGFRCMASNSDPDKAPRYLYRKNLFGDVTEIYNEAGTIVGKYSYTAFGVCTKELDTDGIATTNPIRYRSYYYDEESELYYLQTRYYDPETGRFITIDDVKYLTKDAINGLNLYAYCLNNPISYVDIVGQKPWRIGIVDYENLDRFPDLPSWLIMKGFYGEFEISVESSRSETTFLNAGVGVIEFGYRNQFEMPEETPYGVTYELSILGLEFLMLRLVLA